MHADDVFKVVSGEDQMCQIAMHQRYLDLRSKQNFYLMKVQQNHLVQIMLLRLLMT